MQNDPYRHHVGRYLGVEKYPFFDPNAKTIIEAFKEIGLPELDPNSAQQIGTGRIQIMARNGTRQSMNSAFITPIRGKRPNLFIKTNAQKTGSFSKKKKFTKNKRKIYAVLRRVVFAYSCRIIRLPLP